jgi:pyrroline-5-carboxylate reductase
MVERVGIIGVGHLAGYLVEGLRRADPELEIVLSPRNAARSARLAARFGATVATDNQAVADAAALILVTTRPDDVLPVCKRVAFRPEQTVVTTAVGVPLSALEAAVSPAVAVRALPITCAAIGRSPTLLFPDHPPARALFELVGGVHVLDDKTQFTPASTVSAFYGWVYALMDEVIAWTVQAGVPSQIARDLVLETTRGVAEMSLAHPEQDLAVLLDSLATPGGITRLGLQVLRNRHSLDAWIEALAAVLDRLRTDVTGEVLKWPETSYKP